MAGGARVGDLGAAKSVRPFLVDDLGCNQGFKSQRFSRSRRYSNVLLHGILGAGWARCNGIAAWRESTNHTSSS